MRDALSLFYFDFVDVVPLECVLPPEHVRFDTKLAAMMLLPLLLLLALLLAAGLSAVATGKEFRIACSSPPLCRCGFWLLLLVYPTVSRTMLSTFIWIGAKRQRYLYMDTSFPFGVGDWWGLAVAASIGLAVFSLGVPYSLYRLARTVSGTGAVPSAEQVQRVSVISSSYRAQYWYFESIDLVRKLINTAVVSVAWQGTTVQLWFAAVAATLTLFAYSMLQPYEDPICNHVQLMALLQVERDRLLKRAALAHLHLSAVLLSP